ncbi:hypothetical protein DVB69_02025 [Sporosarcina sp. BI001-red]|nr:hypothetical protein DVB69_02025 [Sporosarcina sp. BI001-red]
MLSIPNNRIGSDAGMDKDNGKLGDGNSIDSKDKQTANERGTIRPYEEVVGQYKDAYLKRTEQLPLSPELEKILTDYFSSIE